MRLGHGQPVTQASACAKEHFGPEIFADIQSNTLATTPWDFYILVYTATIRQMSIIISAKRLKRATVNAEVSIHDSITLSAISGSLCIRTVAVMYVVEPVGAWQDARSKAVQLAPCEL